ncbi:MAG: CehA/McbA family metallohydrolase domain-containing protein [Armatimonadota bacterium]
MMTLRLFFGTCFIAILVLASLACAAASFNIENCEKLATGGFMEAPALASSANGSAWIVWLSREPGGKEKVLARTYQGSWLPAAPVTAVSDKYESPTVACMRDGSPIVVWVAIKGDRWILEGSANSKGKWSKPSSVSLRDGKAANPALASSSGGSVFAVWESYAKGKTGIMLNTYSRGRWGKPVAVTSNGPNAYDPALAVDKKSGKLWIAYSAVDNLSERSVFLVDFDLKSHRLGTKVPIAVGGKLSDAPNQNTRPSVLCDDNGRVWVAYEFDTDKLEKRRPTCYFGDRACGVMCYSGGKLWAVKPEARDHLGRDVMADNEDYFPALVRDGSGRILLFSRMVRPKESYSKDEPLRTNYYSRASALDGSKGWSVPATLLQGKEYELGDISKTAVVSADANSVWIAWSGDNIKYTGLFAKLADFLPVTSNIWVARVRLTDNNQGLGVAKLEETSAGAPTNLSVIKSGAMRGRAAVKRQTVTENGQKYTLIMGNLHEHTNTPSSCGVPSNGDGPSCEKYRAAIDRQGYDFATITDHDFGLYYDAAWRKAMRIADYYDIPQYFIAVPAYEFSFINTTWGKTYQPLRGSQILYFGGDKSAMRFIKEDGRPYCQLDEETNDLGKLLKKLHQLNIDAMLPPHQLNDFYSVDDWDVVDPQYRTVMEIFQIRGSYEYEGCPWQSKAHFMGDGNPADKSDSAWAQNALARGQRMGFIAAADHRSTGTGMTVLMVKDVTREGVIEAMKSRRCYATTGDKIFVDFRVNGHLMGEELTASTPPHITASIEGTDPLDSVTVFKNNKVIYEKKKADILGSTQHKIDFVDSDFNANSYYYLRVVQQNKEMAWASPIWVDKTFQ